MNKSTLVKVQCELVGATAELPEYVLPTYEDVLRYYLFIFGSLKKQSKKDPSTKGILEVLLNSIKNI